MRVYLAGRYSRREELLRYRKHLVSLGIAVTASWLDGSHEIDRNGLSVQASDEARQRFAEEDWFDLTSANTCISFTETPWSTNGRGGRHVEFGAAMALGLRCIVIGPRENVFHHLPGVEWYATWDDFAATLGEPVLT